MTRDGAVELRQLGLPEPTIDGATMRRLMGKREWQRPKPFGPDGWYMQRVDRTATIIATAAEHDGVEYIHASISRPDRLPDYDDLKALHRAVWRGNGWAYQVFAPASHHVNIHEFALHLWGRSNGAAVLPEFGAEGTI